jgi:hypothetical protein
MNTLKTIFVEMLRWILRAFVFPILTLLIVLIVIFNLIPQATMREYAAGQISSRIHRQVDIGTLHFGLTGLTVDSLRLSEVPNFKAGMLFDAKGIRLGWDLRSLREGLDLRKKAVTKSSGSFRIDDFRNPHYLARDFTVRWSLSGIDSSLTHLNGWAKLDQGAGLLQNVDQLMATSPTAKIALAPVMALINIEKLGIVKLGLPDLRHWPIQDIKGNYVFKDGLMTIKEFKIDSPQLGMGTTGTVDLGSGKLLLDAELHEPKTSLAGALDAKLRVTGTTSNPKVDLSNLKKQAFQATVKNLLENPENVKKNFDATLKNIFH